MGPRPVSAAPGGVDLVLGTGGLGTGTLLALVGSHTLGREESRAVRALDQQDRCKAHIILHYVRRLTEPAVVVMPFGRVGADPDGELVLRELAAEGMDLSAVSTDPVHRTLTSVCFSYPDGTGGNLTLTDSASDAVDVDDVEALAPILRGAGPRGIVLAAPEVPLDTREALLRQAGEHGLLRFASFLSGEMADVLARGLLDLVDILSINLDEAATLAGLAPDDQADPAAVAQTAAAELRLRAPRLRFCLTAGRHGSWLWDGTELHHQSPLIVAPLNTAGAGDAHLAGLIVGATAGLSLVESNRLATAISAMSVLSADTIHTGIDRASLLAFVDATAPALLDTSIREALSALDKEKIR